ncbi:MAG: hypothetical protein ACFB20_01555 [Opitutales bacterium]
MPQRNSPSNLALALTPFLTAFFGLALGSFLGVVHLAALPVEEVESVPEDAPDNQIFLLKTQRAGFQWEPREAQLLDPEVTEVRLVEGEINAWLAARLRETKADPDAAFKPVSLPTVRLADDHIHLAVKLGLDTGAGGGETWLQVEGYLESTSKGPRLHCLGGSLGSGRLPGPAAEILLAMALSDRLEHKDLQPVLAAWSQLKGAEIHGDALVLKR